MKTPNKEEAGPTTAVYPDQGKRGQKRSLETCRKISEMKTLRAAERRASRPKCLCFCGCGQALPERAGKHILYLWGHQQQLRRGEKRSPETCLKISESLKQLRAGGWERSKESRLLAGRKSRETKLARKAAGKIYGRRGSNVKLIGYKWPAEVIERRAAPLRGRPQVKPLVAKGPQNKRSISGILRSPDNVTYQFRNLTHFVRNNTHLFLPEDLQWYGKGNNSCRANKGLLRLTAKNHTRGSWKGWTLVSFTETFYNRGETLLSGETLVL